MPIGADPLASYCFHVEIDSITIAQFKSVSGLSIAVNVIQHQANLASGRPVVKKLPGSAKFDDLVLQRGKVNDAAFWTWIQQVQEGKIDAARKHGSIVLYDYAQGQVQRFSFENGWPSKVEVGKLEAGSDSVLLETVTITHERLTVG
jgi:phage tail-like protein